MALQNGNKTSIAIISAAVVTTVVASIDLSRGGVAIASMAVTGFFGFLGGTLMGKNL